MDNSGELDDTSEGLGEDPTAGVVKNHKGSIGVPAQADDAVKVAQELSQRISKEIAEESEIEDATITEVKDSSSEELKEELSIDPTQHPQPPEEPKHTEVEEVPMHETVTGGDTTVSEVVVKRGSKFLREIDSWPTITPTEVVQVCDKKLAEYPNPENWIFRRDAAVIGIFTAFGKRSAEIITLRLNDFVWLPDHLDLTFTLVKKDPKPKKKCMGCGKLRSSDDIECGKCLLPLTGKNVQIVKIQLSPEKKVIRKTKPFDMLTPESKRIGEYMKTWCDEVRERALKTNPEDKNPYICTKSEREWEGDPIWGTQLDRASCADILNRFGKGDPKDPERWWPHLFRHSLASRISVLYASEGKDATDFLMSFFDWKNREVAMHYAELGQKARLDRASLDNTAKLYK